jgi:hypothetical protein
MIDQRNSSANKSAFFLDQLTKRVMEFDMMKTNPEDLQFQVQHCCIDLHSINLVEKIQWQQKKEQDLSLYQPRTIQDIMVLINSKFSKDIENHPVLMTIIDAQFD